MGMQHTKASTGLDGSFYAAVVKPQIMKSLRRLSKEQIDDVNELLQMLPDADQKSANEILDAFWEIICPEDGWLDEVPPGEDAGARSKVEDYRKQVGQKIRAMREARGFTQSELADKAGLRQSHLSRLESGQHHPSFLTMKKIAKVLKVKPSSLDPGFDSEI